VHACLFRNWKKIVFIRGIKMQLLASYLVLISLKKPYISLLLRAQKLEIRCFLQMENNIILVHIRLGTANALTAISPSYFLASATR
jgi:hypothetical protein